MIRPLTYDFPTVLLMMVPIPTLGSAGVPVVTETCKLLCRAGFVPSGLQSNCSTESTLPEAAGGPLTTTEKPWETHGKTMGNSDFMRFYDDFPWDLMMVKTVNNYEIYEIGLPETHGKMILVSHRGF